MFNFLSENQQYFKKIKIRYESKFDDIIITPDFMYHITNTTYIDKILKIGLVPKSKNKLSNHPDRIYLCEKIENCEKLKNLMFMNDDYYMTGINYKPKNNKLKSYTILKVDMRGLDNIKVFKDPNYEDKGFYITKNIPKERLSIIKKLDIQK